MRIINKQLLKRFREPGLCECCRKPCPDGRDPHHVFSRGAGRVDIPENLVSLCRDCHNGFHTSSKPTRAALLAIAAKREGVTPEEAEATVDRLRRDKSCKTRVVES